MQVSQTFLEFESYWSLTEDERTLLKGKNASSRLNVALLLKFFQINGHFPERITDIPEQVLEYLAESLELGGVIESVFEIPERTHERYRAEIRNFLGFRPACIEDSISAQHFLTVHLKNSGRDDEGVLLKELKEWYRSKHIEPPTIERQKRIIGTALQEFETEIFRDIHGKLSAETKQAIDLLLLTNSQDSLGFSDLKANVGRVSLDSVLQELSKLTCINNLALPENLYSGFSEQAIKTYRLRAGTESVRDMREHPTEQRYAMAAIFCAERRFEIIDGLIDLLIQVIHKIKVTAEKKVISELVKDISAVRGKTGLLYKLAEAALENPDSTVEEALYAVVDKETLTALVQEYRHKGPAYQRPKYRTKNLAIA